MIRFLYSLARSLACLVPLEHATFAHTFVFPHTADFRRPALLESLRQTLPTAPSKEPPLLRQKGAQNPRNLLADDSGETRPDESQFDLKWPAYIDFEDFLECSFLAENRAEMAPGAQEWRFL